MRAAVGTPEEVCLAGAGIPVAAADALEEYGEVYAVPVEVGSEAVGVAGQRVAYYGAVAGVVYGVFARGDFVVPVDVEEFHVAGVEALAGRGGVDALCEQRAVYFIGVSGGFLVGAEQSAHAVAPYFAEALAHIVLRYESGVVVEASHFGHVVAQAAVHRVVESASEQREAVAPCKAYFPAVGAHVGGVCARLGSAVYTRKRCAGHHHVGGVADVVVAGEVEAVVEEGEVYAPVVGGDGLPCEVARYGGVFTGVQEVVGAVESEITVCESRVYFFDEEVVGYLLVAEAAHREAYFGVVPPFAHRLPEFFLTHAPA